MAYFPFFVDLEGRRCLVAGGGAVACRKVETLYEYGPVITVTAPEIGGELEAFLREHEEEGRLRVCRREFRDEDLSGADFAVAATGDDGVNRHIAALCRERRLPVNVVDVKEECSFIFPALIKEKDITVGISTSGSSPTMAQYLKKAFREAIPGSFEDLSRQLGEYRQLVKEQVPELAVRTAIFKEMMDLGVRSGGRLTQKMVEDLIAEHRKTERGQG